MPPNEILHQAAISVIYTLVSEVQLSNAYPSIEVTPSGMIMLVSELQPENAQPPIEVMLSGIVILVSELQ